MDTMIGDEKNIKDSTSETGIVLKDKLPAVSYSKLNKLITALYMVTDILDKDEPIRNKLRTLGTAVISDANSASTQAGSKISEIISFLDIASAVGMISEMNCNILKKEFTELKRSISESNVEGNQAWLEGFIVGSSGTYSERRTEKLAEEPKIYQEQRTRIGVQKGSTLMKALSAVSMSNRVTVHKENIKDNFDLLKQERRNEILRIIKDKKEATITDIRNGAKDISATGKSVLISCSEKTLQRELISMLKDNVLKKSGEKRWSKYFIAG